MWNPRKLTLADPLSVGIWNLCTCIYMLSIFTWHASCVVIVWEALIYDGAWTGLEHIYTVSSDYGFFLATFLFFFFYLNASSVMQFKRGRCLQINKVKATIQAFNNEFCRLMLLLLGFPEWVSLKWALLSCFCLLSLSVLRIMSNIIPRGSEEIWRRLVWCNTLSYIWVTENSNIIWFMSQIACWAWESRNGNCLCRESELQHAGY